MCMELRQPQVTGNGMGVSASPPSEPPALVAAWFTPREMCLLEGVAKGSPGGVRRPHDAVACQPDVLSYNPCIWAVKWRLSHSSTAAVRQHRWVSLHSFHCANRGGGCVGVLAAAGAACNRHAGAGHRGRTTRVEGRARRGTYRLDTRRGGGGVQHTAAGPHVRRCFRAPPEPRPPPGPPSPGSLADLSHASDGRTLCSSCELEG